MQHRCSPLHIDTVITLSDLRGVACSFVKSITTESVLATNFLWRKKKTSASLFNLWYCFYCLFGRPEMPLGLIFWANNCAASLLDWCETTEVRFLICDNHQITNHHLLLLLDHTSSSSEGKENIQYIYVDIYSTVQKVSGTYQKKKTLTCQKSWD